MTPHRRDAVAFACSRSRRRRIHPKTADVAAKRRKKNNLKTVLCLKVSAEDFLPILEEFQALVVKVESRVSGEVELQEFWGKNLRQRDLGQLVAAQIDALKTAWRELNMNVVLNRFSNFKFLPLFGCLRTWTTI